MKKVLLYLFVVAVVVAAFGTAEADYKGPWACKCIGMSLGLGEWAHSTLGCGAGGMGGKSGDIENNLAGPCEYISCRPGWIYKGEEGYDAYSGWKCVPRATY
ncbi:MAG: hypothetical protein M0009_14260 [Deltaproteobacteria bacterium]|nr:hypothetical protein [Deltaproteobacteria bacterium]